MQKVVSAVLHGRGAAFARNSLEYLDGNRNQADICLEGLWDFQVDMEDIDATELVPYSLHSWEYLFLDAEGDFADCLARMEMVLDAAERLGVRDITLHPPVILDATVSFEDRQSKFAYFLCLLRSRLAERGLSCQLSLENVWDEESALRLPEDLQLFIEGSGQLGLGICLDTGHLVALGADGEAALSPLVSGTVQSTHIHDNDGTRDSHFLPGEGRFDWPFFFQRLKISKYGGPLLLEVIPEGTVSPHEEITTAWRCWRELTGRSEAIALRCGKQMPDPPSDVRGLFSGRALLVAGNIDAAEEAFSRLACAGAGTPIGSQALGWLGRCCEKRRDFAGATQYYRQMLACAGREFLNSDGLLFISPQIAHYRLAEILFFQERYHYALVAYQRLAREYAGTNHEKWALLKQAYIYGEKLGCRTAAVDVWQHFSRMNTNEIFAGIISSNLARQN